MFEREEWRVIENLINREIRKEEKRFRNPQVGGLDIQARKISLLRNLAQKVQRMMSHATAE